MNDMSLLYIRAKREIKVFGQAFYKRLENLSEKLKNRNGLTFR